MGVVITGPVEATDRARVIAFLSAEGYTHPVHPTDRIFAAWVDADIVGAVRLAAEHGETVLRGMRVRGDQQRRGIGRQLLRRLADVLGTGTCYCLPYRWLITFYADIGFQVIRAEEAPAFLVERHASYTQRGLDVVIMARRSRVV